LPGSSSVVRSLTGGVWFGRLAFAGLLTAPIVSATNPGELKDLFAAPNLKLDAESVAALNKASA
jgi:aryl-alcohol dehydrogenase-like predicted oxidoreductase